jgi:hypothetical protein
MVNVEERYLIRPHVISQKTLQVVSSRQLKQTVIYSFLNFEIILYFQPNFLRDNGLLGIV